MSKSVPTTIGICWVSYAAFQGHPALESNAVSREAGIVCERAAAIKNEAEKSQALFGKKAEAISQLNALAYDCSEQNWDGNDASAIDPAAVLIAREFLRSMPAGLEIPEFAPEPDGSISLDWIKSRSRIFSISIGNSYRLAYAWLDGADKGHGVSLFYGNRIPERVLEEIRNISYYGNPLFRPA